MRQLRDAVGQVLGNAALRRVETAWLLGVASEWAYLVSLLVVAYDVGGVLGVGLLGTLRMLPAALLAPLVGSASDRLPRAAVLVGVHATRATLVGIAAGWLILGLPAAALFALAVVEGIAATLHRPTTVSLLPELSRSPRELIAANAVTSAGEALGVLLGPALGGLLLAVEGPRLGLVVPAVGFASAALMAALVAARSHARGPLGAAPGLARGFAALRHFPSAGWLVSIFAVQTFVRGALTVLLVAASIELLGLGRSGVGYLTSALGAGSLLGAVAAVSLAIGARVSRSFSVSLAVWGIPIAIVGFIPEVGIAFAGLAVIGMANAVLDVSGFTLLLRCLPNDVRGRVLGILEGLVSLTVALGSLAAPALVALFGLQSTLVAVGILLPALAIVSWPIVRRAEGAALVHDRELELLRGVPLFAPLPLATAERLAGGLEPFSVDAGSAVVRQGEPGDHYFVVAEGSAEVLVDGASTGRILAGGGFGEIALLRDVPRTATVVATEPLSGYRLGREVFLEAITGTPPAAAEAERTVERHLSQPEA